MSAEAANSVAHDLYFKEYMQWINLHAAQRIENQCNKPRTISDESICPDCQKAHDGAEKSFKADKSRVIGRHYCPLPERQKA
jgi:hypothetical protein